MTKKKVPCEIYSRVVGYYRPVENWNVGKQAEFKDRVVYDADESLRREEQRHIVNGEDNA